jgi:hypothetical protein
MTQTLPSTAPAVYAAFFTASREAAELQEQPVNVFPFALELFEPAQYVLITEIANHNWEWESIGSFTQRERYEIRGAATVFRGDDIANNPEIAVNVLEETYSVFNECVMRPLMSNRNEPILNVKGVQASPFLMLPEFTRYSAGAGQLGGGPGGWYGRLDWAFSFEALVNPA